MRSPVHANGFSVRVCRTAEREQILQKKYDDIPVDRHCGLTYSENHLFGQGDKDTWWIGFDCGHFCDRADKETFEKYYMDELKSKAVDTERASVISAYMMFELYSEYPVRTQEYVECECRKIVDQIAGDE